MTLMEKFDYEDNVYYYVNNKFTDEHFICLEGEELINVSLFYYGQKDYKSLEKHELIDLIKSLKESELYAVVKEMCLYVLEEFKGDEYTIKTILPILTSSFRFLKQPRDAINVALNYIPHYASVALYTSLAAAYCDVEEYENALKYANRAYAMQGGSVGGGNELSSVYERIKKEMEKNK